MPKPDRLTIDEAQRMPERDLLISIYVELAELRERFDLGELRRDDNCRRHAEDIAKTHGAVFGGRDGVGLKTQTAVLTAAFSLITTVGLVLFGFLLTKAFGG